MTRTLERGFIKPFIISKAYLIEIKKKRSSITSKQTCEIMGKKKTTEFRQDSIEIIR